MALARAGQQRYQSLLSRGFVAHVQLQDREAELLEQQQQLSTLQRARLALQSQHALIAAEWRVARLQSERAAATGERTLTEIDQQLVDNELRREQIVTAPRDGTIGPIAVHAGESLVIGQTAVTLLPTDSKLEAVLLAPPHAASAARRGMLVWLRYHGWPYRKYGQHAGRIRDISPTAMRDDELRHIVGLRPGAQHTEPAYRVRVVLDQQHVFIQGRPISLTPGMPIDASIAADRRRLYEWLLEPLYITRGRN